MPIYNRINVMYYSKDDTTGKYLSFNFAFMDLEYSDKNFIWDHMADFERAYTRMQGPVLWEKKI